MTGRLIGVGVGPGDPDLLTIRGRDALRGADVVFVPVADATSLVGGEVGYAERVVRAHVPHATTVSRLAFTLDEDPQAREASWQEAGEAVAAVVRGGATAAFATIGDPNVYSTFTYLARVVRRLAPHVAIETVPGITAFQDLAARSGTVLVEGDETLALLPFTSGEAPLRDALGRFATVVCYKGGRKLPEVAEVLRSAGRADEAVYGARLGLRGEEVRAPGDLPSGPGPYLSTVIVVPHRDGDRPGTGPAPPGAGT